MESRDELPAVEARRQWIITRRLQITATLTEWKRQFFAEGVSRPLDDRCTLEAEDAALALELHEIKGACVAAKAQRSRRLHAGVLAQLQKLLVKRGLEDVLIEAQERAAEELGEEA